jgi:hypothetical protein
MVDDDSGIDLPTCTSDAQCAERMGASTASIGCAVSLCDRATGRCELRAKDADHDEELAPCDIPGQSIPDGDDCDDNDGTSHPMGEEVCDGADNDCDGSIDEDVPVSSRACATELKGVCEAHGFLECEGGDYTRCNAVPVSQAAELGTMECSGLDITCDGKLDREGCICESGELRECPQPCGASLQVACSAGEFPDCPVGPSAQAYCTDADGDSFPGACDNYCPAAVPVGYRSSSEFGGRPIDCDDGNVARSPGNGEVCDGVDNNCSHGTADEPPTSCGPCPQVACGASCAAQCPTGYSPQGDGTCLSNTEYTVYHEDRNVCALFPCFGLREDKSISLNCHAGQVRSETLSVGAVSGPGNCSAGYASDNPLDCSINVHFGAAACDCFVCQIHVASRGRVPQCQ